MDGPISTNEAAGPAQQAASVVFRSPSVGPPEKVPPVSEGNRSRTSGRDETGRPGGAKANQATRDRKAEPGRQATTREPAYFVDLGPAEARDADRSSPTGPSRDVPPIPLKGEAKEKEEPLSADRASAAPVSDGKGPFAAEADKGREALPLPGDPSASTPGEVLADALAAVKARWAEVNQETLEAGSLAGEGEALWSEGIEGTEDASSRPLQDPSRDAAPREGRNITETPRTSSPADAEFSSKATDSTALPGENSRGAEKDNGLQHQLAIRYQSLATSLSNPHPTQPIIDLFV